MDVHAFATQQCRVLTTCYPESTGLGGFPAFYDRCYHSAIVRLLEEHGFEVVEVHAGYYHSRYYGFFIPLYLLSVLYELIISKLDIKDLCGYLLVVARKR